MLVSISIVAYNEEDNIKKSLTSALNQSCKPIEIFLIDNASQDKTIERANEAYKESGSTAPFSVIKNSTNVGFGAGHNIGFEASRGDLILCLNADCELDRDYVQYAVEVFKRDKNIGAVQGRLVNPRTGNIDTVGLVIFRNRRVVNRGQGEKDAGQYNNAEEIWGVDGAAPIYSRKALDDTKVCGEFFDEDFFAYKEDIDLSWRMRLAGWRMYYEPRAFGYHDRSAGEGISKYPWQIINSRKGISEFAKYHSFANQRLMQIKNETAGVFIKHLPLIFVKELAAWPYVLLFERYGGRSALKFFKLIRKMIAKRRLIMANRRVDSSLMERWFL